MIKESVDHSRNVREAAIEEYRKSSDANSASLRAYCYDGEDLIEEVPLLLKWDDIRMKLEKRNAKLVNLRKRYATGQAKPPKK